MTPVVLDTNVLVSGLLSSHGPPGVLVELLLNGDLEAQVDARILDEYDDVLHRPKLRLDHATVEVIMGHLRMHAQLWVPAPLPMSLPDPDDEPFLAAALAAGCHLVTGNLRHYPKASRCGAVVATPREFIEWLGHGKAG